jgi:hypothetical protein
MVAAYRVRKDARRVFRETLRGELQEMLDGERVRIVAATQALLERERGTVFAKFDEVHEAAQARIAEANAALEQRGAAMMEEVQRRAQEVEARAGEIAAAAVEAAKAEFLAGTASEHGRALAEKSVDAREAKAARKVVNEGVIMQALGPKAQILRSLNPDWYDKLCGLAPAALADALRTIGAGERQDDPAFNAARSMGVRAPASSGLPY